MDDRLDGRRDDRLDGRRDDRLEGRPDDRLLPCAPGYKLVICELQVGYNSVLSRF